LRFLVAGATNTAITFAVYVALLLMVSHQVAYSLAFVFGVALAYVLNRTFVFGARGGVGAMALFPMVYVAQYIVGLLVVTVWVDVLGLPPALASMAAVMLTIPLTYVLSRWIFVTRERQRD
jgi:putative flippase GtrA